MLNRILSKQQYSKFIITADKCITLRYNKFNTYDKNTFVPQGVFYFSIQLGVDEIMKESDIENYIKLFNNDFKCNFSENRFSFLTKLFSEYINQKITDPKRN